MRIFALQIHNEGEIGLDDVFLFNEFIDVCNEYKNKLSYYRNKGELRAIEEPTYDEETLEAHGSFVIVENGSTITARVYEYDI